MQVVSDLMNYSTYCCCIDITGASLLYGLRLVVGPLPCLVLSTGGLVLQINIAIFCGMVNCVTLVHLMLSQTHIQEKNFNKFLYSKKTRPPYLGSCGLPKLKCTLKVYPKSVPYKCTVKV